VVPCAPRVHKPNGNWIGSARLANVSNTHRQTEHGIPVNIRHIIHYAQQCGQKGIILLLINNNNDNNDRLTAFDPGQPG